MSKKTYRFPPLLGIMLLFFLCIRSYGQERRAEDALADFMDHLEWVEESGFFSVLKAVQEIPVQIQYP
jgi:hypothetical protein